MTVFDGVLRAIYKKPCWGVTQGYGSILKMNFGEPHLLIREPMEASAGVSKRIRQHLLRRTVRIRGDWCLTIFGCDWTLAINGASVADSDSPRGKIRKALAKFSGQSLISVSGDIRKGQWLFMFDLGAVLKTKKTDQTIEQWWLAEPSGYTLSVRGNGEYSHTPPGVKSKKKKWRAIKGGQNKKMVPSVP